jgi:hypothetical protein
LDGLEVQSVTNGPNSVIDGGIAVDGPATNLIGNGELETGTSGSNSFGGGILSITAQGAYSGSSLVHSGRTETFMGPMVSLLNLVEGGDPIRISVLLHGGGQLGRDRSSM